MPPTPTVQSPQQAQQILSGTTKTAIQTLSGVVKGVLDNDPRPKEANQVEAWKDRVLSAIVTEARGQLGNFAVVLEQWKKEFGSSVSKYQDFNDFLSTELPPLVDRALGVQPQQEEESKEESSGEPKKEVGEAQKPLPRDQVYEVAKLLFSSYNYFYERLVSRAVFQIAYPYKEGLGKSLLVSIFGRPGTKGEESMMTNWGWPKEVPEFLAEALGPLSEFKAKGGDLTALARQIAKRAEVYDNAAMVQSYGPQSIQGAVSYTLEQIKKVLPDPAQIKAVFLAALASLSGYKGSLPTKELEELAIKSLQRQGLDPNDERRLDREMDRLEALYSPPAFNVPPVTRKLFQVAYDQYQGSTATTAQRAGVWVPILGIRLLSRLGRSYAKIHAR